MSKLISELPEVIKLRALECQRNEMDGIYNKITNELVFAFCWHDTKEGANIWNEVNKSNYELFYKFHEKIPINNNTSNVQQWCKDKGYNDYYVMIIEQYLNENK